MQRAAYCPRTDEVSGDVGPLHLEGAPAAGELRVVGDIGGVVKSGVVEADEVSVLGGLDVRLDEVGALVDGAHVRRRRLLGELPVGAPVRDVEGARRLQRRPVLPRAAIPDQRPGRDAARAHRHCHQHHTEGRHIRRCDRRLRIEEVDWTAAAASAICLYKEMARGIF